MSASYMPVIITVDRPSDDCCDDEDLDPKAKQLRNYKDQFITRRILTVVTIVTIIVVFLVILTSSVVYDIKNNPRDEYEEFNCNRTNSPEDLSCVSHLCPDGWEWDWDKHQCKRKNGFDSCCVDCLSRHILCYNSNNTSISCCPMADTLEMGVAPGAYKDLCRKGYLWVEWKKKCIRTN